MDTCLRRYERVARNFFAVFLIAFLLSPSALACSVSYKDRSGQFNYEALGQTVYSDKIWSFYSTNALSLINKGHSSLDIIISSQTEIYVAKPIFIQTEAKLASLDDHPLAFVKFKPVLTLNGKNREFIWFSNYFDQVSPVLDPAYIPTKEIPAYKQFLQQEQQQADSHSGFAFWDHNIFPEPGFPYLEDLSTCEPRTTPHFDANRYYLVIRSGLQGDQVITEPLSGLDDPLIAVIKKKLSDGKNGRIRKQITAKSYFENMKFAAPVKLQSCSSRLLKANRKTDWWDPYTKFPYSLERSGINLQGAEFKSPIKHKRKISKTLVGRLNDKWPALFEYYGDKDLKGVTCNGHEEFLVFGYHDSWAYPLYSTNQNEPKGGVSELRFAKIVNGQVIVASIKTNYQIQSLNKIPLEDVLSWIPDTEYDPWVWTEK